MDQRIWNEQESQQRRVSVRRPLERRLPVRYQVGGIGEDEVVDVSVPNLHVRVLPLAVDDENQPEHRREE